MIMKMRGTHAMLNQVLLTLVASLLTEVLSSTVTTAAMIPITFEMVIILSLLSCLWKLHLYIIKSSGLKQLVHSGSTRGIDKMVPNNGQLV